MTPSTTQLTIDDRGVATLTLLRPEKHNALNRDLIDALSVTAARLAADAAVRVVVLRGAGESFCAGGDLEWMKQQFTATPQERMTEARKLANLFRTVNELPKPVIAAVQGSTFGGGIGLVSVCDNAIAAADARFGLTETRLGLIPATIGPYVVARLGEGPARRVFMSARVFPAQEALALGLVGAVVERAELDARIEAEVAPYLSAAPDAVAAAKALARHLGPIIDDAIIEDSIRRLAETWEKPEAQEGIAAFFEKRKPSWCPDS